MVTFAQLEARDAAFHDASNAVQHILCVIHSVKCATPEDTEKLRDGAAEMVRRFSAAKAAYVAAKEGSVGGWDANGALVEEVAQ